MPNLILIKHSLPEIVPTRPPNQWHLSPAGRERCGPLADALARLAPDVIVASVEPKAVETAQLVADCLNQPVRTVPGLHEHDRSNVAWMDGARFEAAVADLFEHPHALVMGKETADQAHARFATTIASLTEEHPDQTLAVVTHGTVITLFVARALGVEPFPLWSRLGLPSFVVLALPDLRLVTVVESVAAATDPL